MQSATREKPKRVLKHVRRDASAEQQVLTVPQSTQITGWTERATWLAISRKKFPHRKCGRKVIILRSELFAFLRSLPGVSAEEAVVQAEAE